MEPQREWNRVANPPDVGDCRKLVTLQYDDGVIWVGIRAWSGANWLNNGESDKREKVLAWQDLPAPAYSDGLMESMSAPTLPAGPL